MVPDTANIGRLHSAQPVPVNKSSEVQHGAQNRWSASTITPHPAQRGGRAKSTICLIGTTICIGQLSRRNDGGTSRVMTTPPPVIFDRDARRRRRDRLARRGPSPLDTGIADELIERLDAVKRTFGTALVINTGTGVLASSLRQRGLSVNETDHSTIFATRAAGIFCDEDRLEVAPRRYDLVIMPDGLDTIDDVPGALIAARRALRDGGLFFACLIGAPSLPVLRETVATADASEGRSIARVHPQIDVRAAGDLLVRAGFALPVADAETLRLSYTSLDRLFEDVRDAGLTNVLVQRRGVSRRWRDTARAAFQSKKNGEGQTVETVTLLVLTGWANEPASEI